MITIANIGLGNFASVANMFRFLEIDVEIRNKPGNIEAVTHLILPGVGAFDTGMKLLKESGWQSALLDMPTNSKILGICLGMHLLTKGSVEGRSPGLGLIDGTCEKFESKKVRVPHIGWNQVHPVPSNSIISTTEKNLFYFSHSYYVKLSYSELSSAITNYDIPFSSAFEKGNILGVQFHPEKSHKYGMNLLRKFSNL